MVYLNTFTINKNPPNVGTVNIPYKDPVTYNIYHEIINRHESQSWGVVKWVEIGTLGTTSQV